MKESVGERIKALRIERGMTLAELSERANLSISYLSQIERDKTTPSLSTLTGIARVFNTGLRYFFEDGDEAAHVVYASQAENGPGRDISPERVRLTVQAGDAMVEVYRVVLRPHMRPEQLAPHAGEEFGFVLAGELTMVVGDERFTLAAGDSIHYDAWQPHAWTNEGDAPCMVLWARSPARSER